MCLGIILTFVFLNDFGGGVEDNPLTLDGFKEARGLYLNLPEATSFAEIELDGLNCLRPGLLVEWISLVS